MPRLCLSSRRACSAVDGFADALVGAATADVAAHEVVDVGVCGLWFFCEQRDRGHNLAGLAVAALGNIFRDPGHLHGMGAIGGEAFDSGDLFSGNTGDRQHARARRFSVDVNSASAALHNAASEFRPGHIQGVAEHPQERHILADVHRLSFSIERESDDHEVLLLKQTSIVQQQGID